MSKTVSLLARELSIEYHRNYFLTKFKNTKFSAPIWARVWHVAHLAQRSKNFAKSFPHRWGISANQYLKYNYPKQNQLLP